jgi:thymidylate synthase
MYLSTDGSYENIYDEADQTVIDQISILINDLKTNPDSRRLMVNAWNVSELDSMTLPPCHFSFQVYTKELSLEERVKYYETTFGRLHFVPPTIDLLNKENIPTRAISLMWNQRSVDTFLGLPFNIASYGLLLEIIAKEVNMVPDELIGNLGDVHLYSNHIEQAKEQIGREPYPLPKLIINDEFWNHEHQTIDGWIKGMEIGDFTLEGYQSHPTIKAPLSN